MFNSLYFVKYLIGIVNCNHTGEMMEVRSGKKENQERNYCV